MSIESYVERWKREAEEKEVQKDNGRRAKDGETKRKPRQKAQKDRRVSGELPEKFGESQG